MCPRLNLGPLSPLLFDVAVEPLALILRLGGIQRGTQNHKVSLNTDDLLLFISKPATSIPWPLVLLKILGRCWAIKLILKKVYFFQLINQQGNSFQAHPFTTQNDKFTYLGITATRYYKDLFNHNLKATLDKAKLDMERWSSLPLSLAGKINSVKMIIMPWFLYLFETLPILLSKSFFRELNKYT